MSTPHLLQQQQTLLAALLDDGTPDAIKREAFSAVLTGARGLKAYQSNGRILAHRVLQAAYPVLAQMVGEASFAELARAFWHACPPERGDMGCWGQGLATFVEGDEQLRPEPYLADVARCEWALHRAAFAADAPIAHDTLAMLTTHDPTQLRLVLAPGLWYWCSPWPVAALVDAHSHQHHCTLPQAAAMLHAQQPQDVVVWREGLRAQLREALGGELAFLQALGSGASLLAAVEQAPKLDFSQWLPVAVRTGLLARVELMDPL